MTDLKAYVVREDYEGYCAVVFADKSVVARREGANELNVTFEEIDSCCREPRLDRYAPGPVPALVLIHEHGWHFECRYCGERIDIESEERAFDPVEHGDDVYCDATCSAREFVRRCARSAAVNAMVELVTANWPGAFVKHVHIYDADLTTLDRNGQAHATATFSFPGGSGMAQWRFGEDTVQLGRDDVAAWELFRGNRA